MATFRLRSYDVSPPGGYWYEQTDGLHRIFPGQPIIEELAKAVSGFRKLNGLSRSGIRDSLEDVDRFICERLGNSDAYCVPCETFDPTIALAQSSPIVTPCKGCGNKVT